MYLKNIKEREITPQVCGIGRVVNVTPDENIYMCQALEGFDKYLIGNLDTGIDLEKMEKFGYIYGEYLDKCQNCWARNICKVSCIALSIQYNELDDKSEPSRWCWLSKKQVEHAVYMYDYITEKKPEILNAL